MPPDDRRPVHLSRFGCLRCPHESKQTRRAVAGAEHTIRPFLADNVSEDENGIVTFEADGGNATAGVHAKQLGYGRAMRTQTMVQLTADLVARLDDRAAREGVSRSRLIRRAIDAYLGEDEHAAAVHAFAAAYHVLPDTPEEMAVAEASARAMIRDARW
ncbi:hypothetical protein BH23ACT9_BH23ACT9_39100 [soil metagenome]